MTILALKIHVSSITYDIINQSDEAKDFEFDLRGEVEVEK